MKKFMLLVWLLFFFGNVEAQTGGRSFFSAVRNPFATTNQQEELPDGNYKSIVNYFSTTGHRATYELEVSVRRQQVVAIFFPNGGYIHNGRNNSDYTYTGGWLNCNRNNYGEITEAYTTVEVTYSNGTKQTFFIELQ